MSKSRKFIGRRTEESHQSLKSTFKLRWLPDNQNWLPKDARSKPRAEVSEATSGRTDVKLKAVATSHALIIPTIRNYEVRNSGACSLSSKARGTGNRFSRIFRESRCSLLPFLLAMVTHNWYLCECCAVLCSVLCGTSTGSVDECKVKNIYQMLSESSRSETS